LVLAFYYYPANNLEYLLTQYNIIIVPADYFGGGEDMQRTKYLRPAISSLVFMVVVLASCGGDDMATSSRTTSQMTSTARTTSTTAGATTSSGTKTTASSVVTTTKTTTTTAKSSSATTAALGDILGRAKDRISVKYDMIITSPDAPEVTQTIWAKANKIRMEMTTGGEKMIVLVDRDAGVMYTYLPDENMAIRQTLDDTAPSSATDAIQSDEEHAPRIIGTETLDGKRCLVVEYRGDDEVVKMWIWEDTGFPLRQEIATTGGKVVIEYKNYDFSQIDDSVFELPAGVEIITM
jgi:hypothetical protein